MIFCAKCQADTKHSQERDHLSHLVVTCVVCGQFFKLPKGMTADEIEENYARRSESNRGQISVEQVAVEHAQTDAVIAELEARQAAREAAAQAPAAEG